MSAVRQLARRSRRLVGKARGRRGADLAYWNQRAEQLGPRAVFNRGHGDEQLDAVTEKQKGVLYPLLREALDGSERVILDFGCGNGRFTPDLAELVRGRAIGIDPIEGLLQLAPRADSVSYTTMSPGRIPLADDSVDAIWVCLVLGGITGERDLKRTVAELGRVLRPGGLLFLAENSSEKPATEHWVFRSTGEYQVLLAPAALEPVGEYEDLGERISVLAGRSPRQVA